VREPEPETIDRARKGDLRAFETLVCEYQADVWRFAFHLTRNRATAEDVTQETFLRAYRALASYKGQAKFTSWLLRIAHNAAVDAYRKTRRETPTPPEPEGRADRAAPGSGAEERARINDAIRRLPVSLREPFVVIEVLGYSYQEASVILGLRVGTVKSRMHRARAALVEALSEREASGEM
jgi:RNA polymerase sigma-70 factor (ECF subfamily)